MGAKVSHVRFLLGQTETQVEVSAQKQEHGVRFRYSKRKQNERSKHPRLGSVEEELMHDQNAFEEEKHRQQELGQRERLGR